MNYILMIKNQNIVATLQKRQTSKTAIDKLFRKTSKKKETSNKPFHHVVSNNNYVHQS